jgi:hypothetical protein
MQAIFAVQTDLGFGKHGRRRELWGFLILYRDAIDATLGEYALFMPYRAMIVEMEVVITMAKRVAVMPLARAGFCKTMEEECKTKDCEVRKCKKQRQVSCDGLPDKAT